MSAASRPAHQRPHLPRAFSICPSSTRTRATYKLHVPPAKHLDYEWNKSRETADLMGTCFQIRFTRLAD